MKTRFLIKITSSSPSVTDSDQTIILVQLFYKPKFTRKVSHVFFTSLMFPLNHYRTKVHISFQFQHSQVKTTHLPKAKAKKQEIRSKESLSSKEEKNLVERTKTQPHRPKSQNTKFEKNLTLQWSITSKVALKKRETQVLLTTI